LSGKKGATMKKLLAILALGAMGCVHARVAQPIAIKQPVDMELSCEQLAIEYKNELQCCR